MKSGLIARVERLEAEAERARPAGQAHRIILRVGEDEAVGMARYEQESGRKIAPADLVIYRVRTCNASSLH